MMLITLTFLYYHQPQKASNVVTKYYSHFVQVVGEEWRKVEPYEGENLTIDFN